MSAGSVLQTFTVSQAGATSAWYGAAYPDYRLSFFTSRLTSNGRMTRTTFQLSYGETGDFSVNSFRLQTGDVKNRTLSVTAEHLSLDDPSSGFSFVRGTFLEGELSRFERAVSAGSTSGRTNALALVGPLMGLMLTHRHKVEFTPLAGFSAGFPLYGKRFSAVGDVRSYTGYALNLQLTGRLFFFLKYLTAELEYRYENRISLFFDGEPFNPVPREVDVTRTHSLSFDLGIPF